MAQDAPGLGGWEAAAFCRFGHEIIDWIADYLADPPTNPVLPAVAPGAVANALPAQAPEEGEGFEEILGDFRSLVLPATTQWNHPGFMAYFSSSGSAPGVLGELLTAALNVNAMLWRTSPAATEPEETVLGWLR